jgi:hypothetical protein
MQTNNSSGLPPGFKFWCAQFVELKNRLDVSHFALAGAEMVQEGNPKPIRPGSSSWLSFYSIS